MLSFLNKYACNAHSQNGEDGIVRETVKRLGLTTGYCVEIGGADGRWMSNTCLLLEHGWSGLYVEADYDRYLQSKSNWASYPQVRHQCCRVNGNNVNAFVNEQCDLLSIDTDGGDYEIFCGLQARPPIVIVEIDSSIEPPGEQINADGGVGYWTMTVAALERGYFVLCHTGNLVLVRQEHGHLFPECDPHPLLEWEKYFNRRWLQ